VAVFNTYVPIFQFAYPVLKHLGGIGLTVTLFLIGTGLSMRTSVRSGFDRSFKESFSGSSSWWVRFRSFAVVGFICKFAQIEHLQILRCPRGSPVCKNATQPIVPPTALW